MLISWMSGNNSQDKLVQQMKNVSCHAGIKHLAMLGIEPKVSLTSSSRPAEIIERPESAECR